MRHANLPSGGMTTVDVGMVWKEIQAPGNGNATFLVPKQTTLRLSAGALTTVVVDGETSITLRAGEVQVINVGTGAPNDNKSVITVDITSTDVAIQQGKMVERGRRDTI